MVYFHRRIRGDQPILSIPVTKEMNDWAEQKHLAVSRNKVDKNSDLYSHLIRKHVAEAAFFWAFQDHAKLISRWGVDFEIDRYHYEIKNKIIQNQALFKNTLYSIQTNQVDMAIADKLVISFYRPTTNDVVFVGTIDPDHIPEVSTFVPKGRPLSSYGGTAFADSYVFDLKWLTPIESLIRSLGGIHAIEKGLYF